MSPDTPRKLRRHKKNISTSIQGDCWRDYTYYRLRNEKIIRAIKFDSQYNDFTSKIILNV